MAGSGKTTALKILAGVEKPNLSNVGEEASYDDLIEYFKGSEAQGFFEKVKQGKIKLSYKPQQVDLIPKQYKGSVKGLLKKVDEKKEKVLFDMSKCPRGSRGGVTGYIIEK